MKNTIKSLKKVNRRVEIITNDLENHYLKDNWNFPK